MSVVDPFAELGVTPDAEQEAVQGAYNALARKYHPDRNPDGEVRMKRLTEAFAIVSDPRERAQWESRRVATGWRSSADGSTPPPPPRSTGPSCAHHSGAQAIASCSSCGRPMCAVCVALRRRLGGGPVCTGCRTGRLQWRIATFAGLLLVGAALWRVAVHPNLVASLLLAYPAAALPTGVRCWRRVRASGLQRALTYVAALSHWARVALVAGQGLAIALLGVVAAPADVSLGLLLVVLEMRTGGTEGWWKRHTLQRWSELRSLATRLRRKFGRTG